MAIPRGQAMLACGVLGAIVGSFLGAALLRMPQGRSVVVGRSACESCGKVLSPAELVPVLSFALQRGRCRGCGAPIDRGQLAAELGGAAVGVAAAWWARDGAHLGLGLVFGWQLLLLALLDARHFWLPNRLVGLLAVTGAVPALLAAVRDPELIVGPLAGAALGFAMLWLPARLYRAWRGFEGLGPGDPKLLAAMGLCLGPMGVVATLLGGALVGLAAAAVLAWRGTEVTSRTALPLGSCLALAGFAVYLLQN